MPLKWKAGENPYELTYFAILGLGANATRQQIVARRENIVAVISAGGSHVVFGREVTIAEVNKAATRLLDEGSWAEEALLVHPLPAGDINRMQALCRSLLKLTAVAPQDPRQRFLELTNLAALAPLLPDLSPDDVPWPDWDELMIPGPASAEDRACDVQYDL